ncbi:hypothetical protein N8772_03055, partial [Rickettsiales bacterium]|nr:hypothetical protein [Rickettsiales bacterium]
PNQWFSCKGRVTGLFFYVSTSRTPPKFVPNLDSPIFQKPLRVFFKGSFGADLEELPLKLNIVVR